MAHDEPATARPAARLASEVRLVAQLQPDERERMFALMSGHFDHVSRRQFFHDLDEKDSVVLMFDCARSTLRGFSTLGRLEADVDGRRVTALFSGDTVIEPEYWGENAWLGVWGQHTFALADRFAPEPLYWLLLTATHRSYRLLGGIFREYYPRPDLPTPPDVQARLDALVRVKFPREYDASNGIVSLCEQTPVRPERLDPAAQQRDDPQVRFFVQANPGYARGDFLACLTRLARDNLTPLGRRVVYGR